MALLDLECLLFDGQLVNPTRAQGVAGLLQGTEEAAGRLGRTLNGTEVHDSLIVGRCLLRWQETLGKGGEGLLALRGVDGCVDAEMSRQHAIDIAIDDGGRQPEGDTADGGGGVVAHTFERTEPFERLGEAAHPDYLTGGIMEVTSPTVVA